MVNRQSLELELRNTERIRQLDGVGGEAEKMVRVGTNRERKEKPHTLITPYNSTVNPRYLR